MPLPCDLPTIPNGGPRKWSMTRNRRGYRTYSITHRVAIDRDTMGPLTALEVTPGLPEPGSVWDEGGIADEWAYFTQEATVEQVGQEENNLFFDVTQVATSDPTGECPEDVKEDPLAINDRIKIESTDLRKEAIFDRDGNLIVNSAFEQYRGSQVEFDDSKLRVVIEQNAAHLDLDLIDSLMHHTNDAPLWGFDIGCVKLSKLEAEPKYYTNCAKYYLRRFTFDIDSEGFTRYLLDEGTKVLHGRWDQNLGTGCTLSLTVSPTGGITAAAIGFTGGTGYPPSCIVPLRVGSGGTDGIVLAETNSAGEVTSIVRIHYAGNGYTAGAAVTTQRGYWVLLRINRTGEVPIYTNPQHFDRPGDIKGQNTRYILDGKGLPIAEEADAGEIAVDYYFSGNLLLLGIPLSLEIP